MKGRFAPIWSEAACCFKEFKASPACGGGGAPPNGGVTEGAEFVSFANLALKNTYRITLCRIKTVLQNVVFCGRINKNVIPNQTEKEVAYDHSRYFKGYAYNARIQG